LRDVLGVTVEEWLPLRAGERVRLAWEEGGADSAGWADCWTEAVKLAGAKPVVRYTDGPAAGGPAVTRYELGDGQAWYVSARTDAATTAALLAAACESAGVTPPGTPAAPATLAATPAAPATLAATPAATPGPVGGWPRDLEIVRRADGERRFVTLINHGEHSADVTIGRRAVTVPAGEVVVIRAGEAPGRSAENEGATP
jgi:beta-galactosidase